MAALDVGFAEDFLKKLSDCTHTTPLPLEDQARATAALLSQYAADSAVSVWKFDEDHQSLACVVGLSPDQKAFSTSFRFTSNNAKNLIEELSQGKPLCVDDLSASPWFKQCVSDYFEPQNINSVIVLPICLNEHLLGAIFWEHRGQQQHEWQTEHLLIATTQIDALALSLSQNQAKPSPNVSEDTKDLRRELDSRKQELENALAELRTTQSHLLETEKLVALGNLVAGVAHEVNTPLGVSITAVSHLDTALSGFENTYQKQTMKRRDLEEFLEVCHETLEILHNNLSRAAEMIKNFKLVAVNQANDVLEDVMIKHLLEALLKSLKHETKKKRVVIELIGPADVSIKSYSGSLYQIFTNLILNSVIHGFDAMEPGECHIRIKFSQIENGGAEIIYSDNGIGLSAEARQRILEPFFTTKRKSGGSGLGMYIVNNLIANKLHGSFTLLEPEQGFACKFRLPKHF